MVQGSEIARYVVRFLYKYSKLVRRSSSARLDKIVTKIELSNIGVLKFCDSRAWSSPGLMDTL